MLSDNQIKKLVTDKDMISPFVESTVRELNGKKALSFGLSSYGYDVRMAETLKVFAAWDVKDQIARKRNQVIADPNEKTPDIHFNSNQKLVTEIPNRLILDPKKFDEDYLFESDSFVIPPLSVALTHTIEYIKMPPNVMAICVGKSTYARVGLICNTTPIEAGWEGQITIELTNSTSAPLRVYPNEGIAQLLFFECEPCSTVYDKRSGKYQGQKGITTSK